MFQITKVKVTNFRGLKDFEADFTAINFVLGWNGIGKTSLFDAIRECLRGQSYDSTGKRIPVSDLIGPWGKEAHVEIDLTTDAEELTVGLTVKGASRTLNVFKEDGTPRFHGSNKEVRAALWKLIDADPVEAECALNPQAVLTTTTLGTLLTKVAGTQSLSIKNVWEAAGIHKEWLEEYVEGYYVADAKATLSNPEEHAPLGKTMEEWRAGQNKTISNLKRQLAEPYVVPTAPSGRDLAVDEMPALDGNILDLIAKERELQNELAVATAVKVSPEDRKQAKQYFEGYTEQKVEFESRLKKRQKDYAYISAHVHKLESEQSAASSKITKAHDELMTLEARDLGVNDEGCCRNCGTPATERLQALVKVHHEAIRDAQAELTYTEKPVEALNVQLEESNAERESLQNGETDSIASATKVLEELQPKLAKAEAEWNAILKEDDRASRDPDVIQAEIENIEERLAGAKDAMDKLKVLEQREEWQSSLNTLETEHTHLDWAVTAFRDGELLKGLMVEGSGLARFVGQCNDLLVEFDLEMHVDIDGKDVTILLNPVGRTSGIPYVLCSKSERVLVQWAVGRSFASAGVVLLDDVDSFDGRRKPKLFKSIKDAGLNTVIVAGAYGQSNQLPNSKDLEAKLGVPWSVVILGDEGEVKT